MLINIEVMDDSRLKVSRLGDAGTEILELELPAVITVRCQHQ
jgi:electron transfer flavoprotein beta subunit